MNAGASAIQGKKLSGERIANLEKMSERTNYFEILKEEQTHKILK
jgi:hypothetical protein